jgi:hypothetical protein
MRLNKLHVLLSFIILALVSIGMVSGSDLVSPTLQQGQQNFEGHRIYFAETNEEASFFDRSGRGMSRFAGLLGELGAELVALDWRHDIPADADLVIIAGPARDLGFDQSARLWLYLYNGGSVLLITDPLVDKGSDIGPALEVNRALVFDRGLFELTWQEYGFRGANTVLAREGELRSVVSPAATVVEGAPTSTPAVAIQVPVLITDFTTSSINPEHPVNAGVSGELGFWGARSIEFNPAIVPAQAIPLIYSPGDYYGETTFGDYLATGISAYNADVEAPPGPQAVAVAVDTVANGSRMIVLGDREFATNGAGLQTSPSNTLGFLYPGNVRFLLNSVAWLLKEDTTTLVQTPFPTPGATATPTVTYTPTVTQTATATDTPTATLTPNRGCSCDGTPLPTLPEVPLVTVTSSG